MIKKKKTISKEKKGAFLRLVKASINSLLSEIGNKIGKSTLITSILHCAEDLNHPHKKEEEKASRRTISICDETNLYIQDSEELTKILAKLKVLQDIKILAQCIKVA